MYRQCGRVLRTGNNTRLTAILMTAKEKIDRFIGEIPKLTEVNNHSTYKFSDNPELNKIYWQGYIQAKLELRDKLYQKENIQIEPPKNPLNEWSPEFNTSLFGKDLYER